VTELLVGTKKGLFVLRGEASSSRPFQIATRAFPGDVVEYAIRDPRNGRYFASVTNGFYGPHLFYTDDPTGKWTQAEGPAFDQGDGATVERIWVIRPAEEQGVLWAGSAPAALWRSEDDGQTWHLNRGLWDQPARPGWQPGAGGLALHTIEPWPGEPDKLAIAISAAGVWLSEDRGLTWKTGYEGLHAEYLPEEARGVSDALCVHNMRRAATDPQRLFMQFHGNVYRSDDAGQSWNSIAKGLPSGFGFPLVTDPADRDSAFVIPLTADVDRVTPEGEARVFETRDAGATWTARGQGLPAGDVYLTVLRQAFDHAGQGPDLGLFFGATSGDVFGSADAGLNWYSVREKLAPVTSVRVA
jgi:photosystem II stability/assembly factor-like uncharacterized protein